MSTVSFQFIAFIFVVLFLYYTVPKKIQWCVLLCSSVCFFVEASGVRLSLVFLIYLILNWAGAIMICILEKNSKAKVKKLLYIGIIIFNIGLLVVFKDLNFFSNTVNGISEILGKPMYIPAINIAAPLGISYFALILTGYITDIYWQKYEPEKNFFRFCLFGGYFPQMSSGPFVKYDEISLSLYQERKFDYDRCISGGLRVIWGFFKKLVISQRLAPIVNTVYGDYNTYAGWYVILAAVSFTLQLYTDFSGAMDIALGISKCFGISLPENFNTPFYSTSIAEFWRRWHITLGSWLREYIFYPIQRSGVLRKIKKWCKKHWGKDYEKKFNLPMYLGMFITWFLIGAWHGGSWNCILMGSGLYYWLLITISEIFTPVFQLTIKTLRINTTCFSWRLFQRVRTFCIFTFGLSFFRASDLREGFELWKAAFDVNNIWIFFDESIYSLGITRKNFNVLFVSFILLAAVDMLKQKYDITEEFLRQNYLFRLFFIISAVIGIIVFGQYGSGYDAATFIYEQF